jgi:hypothetical protein
MFPEELIQVIAALIVTLVAVHYVAQLFPTH